MNLAMLLDIPSMIVPDQTVIIDPASSLEYGDLRARTSQVSGLLSALGVDSGDRVGVFATNSCAVVEVMFGTAARGAALVPMNYRAGSEEVAHLLSDSGIKVLFTETRYRDLIEANRPDSLTETIYIDDGYEAARDGAEADELLAEVDGEDLAALLYTSGTTSLPKGVMLSHESLSGYVMGTNDAATGEDLGTQAIAAPLYHIAGVTSLLNALYSGRRSFLMAQFEAGEWLQTVADRSITHAFLVPTMLARVVDHPDVGSADLSSLEAITYGAAPMPPSVIRRAIETLPDTISFAGAYGQTETTSTVAVLGPDDHSLTGSDAEIETKLRRLTSVGQVLDDVQVRIVSPEGDVLGPDETGEVQLMTFRSMDGYWGKDEKTRVTIDDEGWVHTGDLGYLDSDDYLFLVGREGDMIIRGGENIAPAEVETVLYGHADVMEAAALGIPDAEWGERVEAAVVLREGSTADADELLEHCRGNLAAFKRPAKITVMDELPRTSTGKLLRRDLAPMLAGDS